MPRRYKTLSTNQTPVILLISWLLAWHQPTITTNCWFKTQSYSLSAKLHRLVLHVFMHMALPENKQEKPNSVHMIGYWVRVGRMGISCPLSCLLYPTSKWWLVCDIISCISTKVIWSTCLDIGLDLFCAFTALNCVLRLVMTTHKKRSCQSSHLDLIFGWYTVTIHLLLCNKYVVDY